MTDFLTQYTVEETKVNPEGLRELDYRLEKMVKDLHIRGEHELGNQLYIKGQELPYGCKTLRERWIIGR